MFESASPRQNETDGHPRSAVAFIASFWFSGFSLVFLAPFNYLQPLSFVSWPIHPLSLPQAQQPEQLDGNEQ